MALLTDKLKAANEAVREQWAKFDKALAEGMRGAPLAQIDRKLARLERERDRIMDETR